MLMEISKFAQLDYLLNSPEDYIVSILIDNGFTSINH